MSYDLFSKVSKNSSFHITFQKYLKFCQEITFDFKGQDYCTSFSRWSKWNGGVIIVSHLFQNYKLITDKLSYRNFWLIKNYSYWFVNLSFSYLFVKYSNSFVNTNTGLFISLKSKKNLHKFPKIIKYGIYSLDIHFCFYKTSSLSESTH